MKTTVQNLAVSKKLAALALCLALSCGALVACGGGGSASYADGTYTAQSAVYEGDDEGGSGYGEISITIKDGEIADAEFLTYEPDGTLKDENYGKTANNNQDFYNKAQKAVAACKEYAAKLVETGDVNKVDVISGATISYNEFLEAADAALADASK